MELTRSLVTETCKVSRLKFLAKNAECVFFRVNEIFKNLDGVINFLNSNT